MRILFIGPYSYGSTSKMRGDIIGKLFKDPEITIIDTDIPLNTTSRLFRSLGFRYKTGPLIKNINNYISSKISGHYDLVWIEKGVFIRKNTLITIKENSGKLIHYTPDPAFFYHKSNHFLNSLTLYDYFITTKSYEINSYKRYNVKSVILTTQGYDPTIHKPLVDFDKKNGICFVGHYEKERAYLLQKFLDAGIEIKLAGIKWDRFVKRNSLINNLKYFGESLNGLEYSKLIAGSLFGLGFLSKWIPEKHTTRTFEIPACKTILITERNEETSKYFKENDVVFYDDTGELVERVKALMQDREQLKRLSENGYNAVIKGGYDYESILRKLLTEIEVL